MPALKARDCAVKARHLVVLLVAGLVGCTPAGATPPVPLDSGIRGLVVIGPTCPVERYPPDPLCRPRPHVASIAIRDASGQRLLRTVRSNATGRFSIRLRPGVYRLVPHRGSGIGGPAQFPPTVRVHPDRFSFVRIEYDSGIR